MDAQVISQAVGNGDLDGIRKVLDFTPDIVSVISTASPAGFTPLARAVVQGHVDIVQYLLEAGADINVGYKTEWVDRTQHDLHPGLIENSPPLHCAAIKGSAELVRLLLLYGADANADNGSDRGSKVVPLHVATGEAVHALILAHADIDRENNFGWTPLIYSISRQDIESIRVLVKHGAKVDTDRTTRYKVRVASGEEKLALGTSSPLMVACGHGRLTDQSANIIEILAAAGADVNRRYTVELGPEDGIPPSFTLLSLIYESKSERPRVRSPHSTTEIKKWGQKELQVVALLLQLGSDENDLIV
ncbi:ankyrin repeat protein [Phlyctema vagabunda]|uniref:Ankyrin repeat protein n=1 Tax=Phlyctema vagabunda TaxID=108571 RepID=A0ABR4PPI7_9HELO